MTACQHATSSFWGGSGTGKGETGESNIALRPLQPPGVFLQFSVGIAILSQGKPLTVCYRERYLQHKKQQESFASCYLSNQSSRFTNMLSLRPFPQLEIEHIELRWLFLKKKKKKQAVICSRALWWYSCLSPKADASDDTNHKKLHDLSISAAGSRGFPQSANRQNTLVMDLPQREKDNQPQTWHRRLRFATL